MRIVIEVDSLGNPYCKVIDSDAVRKYHRGYVDLYRCKQPVLYKVRSALADVMVKVYDRLQHGETNNS